MEGPVQIEAAARTVVVQKLAHYAASGYTIGKNLIATFESAATPLSVKQVQTYIKALLM